MNMFPDKKPPSKRDRILFFLIGIVGFVVVFIVGLWLTFELPAFLRWFSQGLIAIAYIWGFVVRFSGKFSDFETSIVQHPLSYYVVHGISLIWLLVIIVVFVLITGGTYLATR